MTSDSDDAADVLIRYVIVGTFEPETLSKRLGIPASACWRAGDVCPPKRVAEKSDGWVLESAFERSDEVVTRVGAMLGALYSLRRKLAALRRRWRLSTSLQVVIYLRRSTGPDLSFPSDMLVRVAAVADDFGIDLYGDSLGGLAQGGAAPRGDQSLHRPRRGRARVR